MSEQLHGGTLSRRLLAEHRRVIVPLAAALVVNVLVYAFAVYPLAQRVANIEQRDQAAEQALALARREHDAARGALTGKERASVELATFYKDVLPQDLSSARRLTYLRLAQLVRESGLRYKSGRMEPADEPRSTLQKLEIELEVEGSYENVRALLYQLDTAPEFVVVDNITLSERSGQATGLELMVELSTYFRPGPP
jgi:Tfp pilus assembly protein PilO